MAAKAASLRRPQLLVLAFAFWPQAQQGSCEAFLLAMSPACAAYCLSVSKELRARAWALGNAQAAREEGERDKATRKAREIIKPTLDKAKEERARGIKERQKEWMNQAPTPPAGPATVVYGRVARKVGKAR